MIDTAYWYPAPFWNEDDSGSIKTTLLFFDEVAILLPDYMYGRHRVADPSLAEPLEDLGLLAVLEPKDWVDETVQRHLTDSLIGLLDAGIFDDVRQTEYFQELSRSRMGYGADVELADELLERLLSRGLAKQSEDGVSVPLQPEVRTTVLVLLAQLARTAGPHHGRSIQPTTNNRAAIRDLLTTFSGEAMPSAGHVVALDIEPVSFDLSLVPLDELLDFRTAHADAHRAYRRDIVRFMAEIATADIEERDALLLQRRQELEDRSSDLRRLARTAFNKNLRSWALGLAGGAWAAKTGDPLSLALAGLGLADSARPTPSAPASAFAYLVEVNRAFG